MKTATVKQVQGHGENNGYYKWEVWLDDDYSGFMFGKKSTCFVNTGDVVEYEREEYKGGIPKVSVRNKVKAAAAVHDDSRQKYNDIQEKRLTFDESKQILIIRQSCLKAAVDWGQTSDLAKLLHTADAMVKYCTTGELPEIKKTDDLPF